MNIDEKIEAKVKAIDEKMKDGTGLDIFKLQSCTREMGNLGGGFGMSGYTSKELDETLKSAGTMIAKLMMLHSLNIFEESIAVKKD